MIILCIACHAMAVVVMGTCEIGRVKRDSFVLGGILGRRVLERPSMRVKTPLCDSLFILGSGSTTSTVLSDQLGV